MRPRKRRRHGVLLLGDHAREIWDSAEACHRFRDSDVEARRRATMDPFVLKERSNFYTGRELGVPGR
jgi:hypothetical protein